MEINYTEIQLKHKSNLSANARFKSGKYQSWRYDDEQTGSQLQAWICNQRKLKEGFESHKLPCQMCEKCLKEPRNLSKSKDHLMKVGQFYKRYMPKSPKQSYAVKDSDF